MLFELEYLLLNIPVLANQLARYRLTEFDVSDHVHTATGGTSFVPPTENTCFFVKHYVVFE